MSSFSMFIAGDYCPIGRIGTMLDTGEHSAIVQNIASITRECDLSIVNLETPITESQQKIIKSGPNIKVGRNAIEPLKIAGIDMVTLANNHILDYGAQGVKDTLAVCRENNIEVVGAAANTKEARKAYYHDVGSKRIAILNFAENEFCAATKSDYGANPVNPITNFYDISAAKDKADFVIVISHGGREHYQLPTPGQRERFRFYVEAGADLVVGHHTHCFSGYEQYKSKNIFYSLGNFIFDYKVKYQTGLWTEAYAVKFNIDIEKMDVNFELIPFWQGRKENPVLTLFDSDRRTKFDTEIKELNKIIADDQLFEQAWDSYLQTQSVGYRGMLFSSNKYIRALVSRGLLPKFLIAASDERKALLLNLHRCETHREIVIDTLRKEIE